MLGPRLGIREQVFFQLREEIISLQLEPGTMVSESELAARLKVSRMPVHDALMALSQNHLVDIYPQRGSQISLIDLKWVDEARFIRQTLETAVTLDLFHVMTEDRLLQLKNSIQKQVFCMENGMIEEFFREDNSFHKMLYTFAGRDESWRIVKDMMTHFDRIRTMTLYVNPHQGLIEDHQEWVRAIEKHDAGTVKVLIDRHLRNYEKNIEAVKEKYAAYFK